MELFDVVDLFGDLEEIDTDMSTLQNQVKALHEELRGQETPIYCVDYGDRVRRVYVNPGLKDVDATDVMMNLLQSGDVYMFEIEKRFLEKGDYLEEHRVYKTRFK